MTAQQTAIEAYVDALQSLRPETIAELMALCRADVHFRDPFNDVRGQTAYAKVLQHMFRKVDALRFDVTQCLGRDREWVLAWRFTGRSRLLGELELQGTSLVVLDANGKVTSHIDHWDPTEQIYGRLPLVGGLFRLMQRAFRA